MGSKRHGADMTAITDDLISLAYTGAKRIIESDPEDKREVTPMAFIYAFGAVAPLPLPWRNDRDKDRMMYALRKVCEQPEVSAYAIVSEAWMVSVTPTEESALNVMPSQHPRRVECIQITTQERGHQMQMASAVIERKDGRRFVGPRTQQDYTGFGGRMVNLFEPLEATN